MARRKVILPNWSVSEEIAKNREMLEVNFSGLTMGELVVNTTSGITSLATLDNTDTPVIFESSAMIDKRLEGFLDNVHKHTNKEVLDGITSGMVGSWNNAEANAIASSKTYTDDQISFVLCGATEAFDTLKEVEEWVESHSGETINIIKDINSLSGNVSALTQYILDNERTISEALNQLNESAGFNANGESILPGKMDLSTAILTISGIVVSLKNISHTHENKEILDEITSGKVSQWDAAEPNVITEISAVTKDNSNVISVNGKKVTIDLTNVGDENVIETIKVNNSALTVSNKTVNVDLSYLETAIKDIELTPGPNGITPVFTAITANVNNATGVPYVSVTSAKTDGEKYALTFDFQNLKGEKGDRGDDGTSVKILGTKQSYDELPSSNNANGDGYIIGENLWVWNGSTWENVGQIKGPQGDPGTNAYITAVTASVSDTTGTPSVKVTTGGTHSEMSINFDFDNLKGIKGDEGRSITSIDKTEGNGAAGTTDVYTITYSDETTSTFNVYNGENGINGNNGITPVFTAVTANVNNATGTPQVSVVTAKTADEKYSMEFSFQNMKGDKGDKGDDGTSVKILGTKYSYDELPPSNNVNGDGYIIGENLWVWNGSAWVDVGQIKGPQGETGVGIAKIERTVGNGAAGTTDTYTITYTNDSISTFTVYNGANGTDGSDGKDGKDGITPVFSSATASITNTTGTPQVTITSAATGSVYSLNFAFSGLKGADGTNGKDGKDGVTPVFSSATATVTNTTGTPKVTVTSAATGSVYSLNFAFSGLKGAEGKQGPQGAPGTNGSRGDIGHGYFSTTDSEDLSSASTTINKSYVNNSGSVRTNDYITSREGEVFMVTGSTASNFNLTYVGSFRGPQGPQGAPGTNAYITGITAVVSDTTGTPSVNITTAGTPSNISFELLFDGLKGKPGENGINGTNGSTWYNGTTEPSTSTGVNGDWYLNTSTWNVYHKESNSWINKGNIKGETGFFDDSELSNYALKSDIPKLDYIKNIKYSGNALTNLIVNGHNITGICDQYFLTPNDLDGYAKTSDIPKLEYSFTGSGNAITNIEVSGYSVSATFSTFLTPNDLNGYAKTSDIPDISGIQSKLDGIAEGAEVNVQSDWGETTITSDAYIKNKPTLATVATSGSYNDLNDKPIIPDISGKVDKVDGKGLSTNDFTNDLKNKLDGIAEGAQVNVQSDWNETTTTSDAYIKNKPTLATVATSGSYNDLENKPTLATVATSGDYNDLSNTPTIPSVDEFIKNISLTTSGEKLYIVGSTSQTGTTTSLNTSTTDVYMQGGEVYAASDERLKDFGDNVKVDFNELSEIPKVYYSWKDDEEKRQMIGTSAQKLREIYPELVSENEDGKMAVSYEKLSIIALAAIDKLHKENEELKDRLKRIEENLGL